MLLQYRLMHLLFNVVVLERRLWSCLLVLSFLWLLNFNALSIRRCSGSDHDLRSIKQAMPDRASFTLWSCTDSHQKWLALLNKANIRQLLFDIDVSILLNIAVQLLLGQKLLQAPPVLCGFVRSLAEASRHICIGCVTLALCWWGDIYRALCAVIDLSRSLPLNGIHFRCAIQIWGCIGRNLQVSSILSLPSFAEESLHVLTFFQCFGILRCSTFLRIKRLVWDIDRSGQSLVSLTCSPMNSKVLIRSLDSRLGHKVCFWLEIKWLTDCSFP